MKAVFKISYYLRSNYKNKQGKCSIMIRIYLNGKMSNLGTSGLSVNPEKWDNKIGRMKSKTAEALNLNYKLDEISTDLNKIYNNLKATDVASLERIKHIFSGKDKAKMTYLQVLEEYNRHYIDLNFIPGRVKRNPYVVQCSSGCKYCLGEMIFSQTALIFDNSQFFSITDGMFYTYSE